MTAFLSSQGQPDILGWVPGAGSPGLQSTGDVLGEWEPGRRGMERAGDRHRLLTVVPIHSGF